LFQLRSFGTFIVYLLGSPDRTLPELLVSVPRNMLVPYVDGVSQGLGLLALSASILSPCESFMLEGIKTIRRLSSIPKSDRLKHIFDSPDHVESIPSIKPCSSGWSFRDYYDLISTKSDLLSSANVPSSEYNSLLVDHLLKLIGDGSYAVEQFLDIKRVLSVEFLQVASSCLIADKRINIRLALSIESAIFASFGQVSNQSYCEKVHEIAIAIAGKNQIISIDKKNIVPC